MVFGKKASMPWEWVVTIILTLLFLLLVLSFISTAGGEGSSTGSMLTDFFRNLF